MAGMVVGDSCRSFDGGGDVLQIIGEDCGECGGLECYYENRNRMDPTVGGRYDFGFFFFFNDTATTEFYPLPLPAALPICCPFPRAPGTGAASASPAAPGARQPGFRRHSAARCRAGGAPGALPAIAPGELPRLAPRREHAGRHAIRRCGAGASCRRSPRRA